MTDKDYHSEPPPQVRGPRFTSIMLAVVVIAGASIAYNEYMRRNELPGATTGQQGGQVGAPFTLTDQTGRKVSDTSFAGRKRLMIFAPSSDRQRIMAALQILNSAREIAGPAAAGIAYIWITTDPENDEPAKLGAMLAEAGGDWTALTGSRQEIRSLMQAFFVPETQTPTASHVVKGTPPTAATIAYLMDKNGLFLSHRIVPPDASAIALWLNKSL